MHFLPYFYNGSEKIEWVAIYLDDLSPCGREQSPSEKIL